MNGTPIQFIWGGIAIETTHIQNIKLHDVLP